MKRLELREFLPCPFCGGTSLLGTEELLVYPDDSEGLEASVKCMCGAQMVNVLGADELKKRWNKRAS